MAHNVQGRGCFGGHQRVLTVSEDDKFSEGDGAVVRFQRRGVHGDRVVISMTGVIEGEDLFAFRELLNELDESAFVEPGPSRVAWVDGDLMIYRGKHIVLSYSRRNGQWDRLRFHLGTGESRLIESGWDDESIEYMLDNMCYELVRRGGKRVS